MRHAKRNGKGDDSFARKMQAVFVFAWFAICGLLGIGILAKSFFGS